MGSPNKSFFWGPLGPIAGLEFVGALIEDFHINSVIISQQMVAPANYSGDT